MGFCFFKTAIEKNTSSNLADIEVHKRR